MSMMAPFDCHLHSDNSLDGFDPVSLLCESAVEKGLKTITVTDHCEINTYLAEGYYKVIQQSVYQTRMAKAMFEGQLEVMTGVELGQALHDRDCAQKVLETYDLDFVLASVHNLLEAPDFYYMDYTHVDVPHLLHKYFEEIEAVCRWGQFDSLAHLTYPLRYICGDHGIAVDMEDFAQQIDGILSLLVQSHKALEINCSGLRQKIGDTMPGLEIVRRFRELGGQYITLGSDAHKARDIGKGIWQGIETAQKAGFTHVTLFRGRRPFLVPIESLKKEREQ